VQEERILREISAWTADDARATLNELLRFVRKKMMPESTGERITQHDILVHFGFSDRAALFPCPLNSKPVERLVSRAATRELARSLSSNQRVCLHGIGGCGKTTVLQELRNLLPEHSVLVVFDCYGGGRYLDSDALRHRPQDERWTETRLQRLSDRGNCLTLHRHGWLPVLEGFHTHLEWHAMWCSAGELLRTRALCDAEPDD
jgi:hypothetical protein